MCVVLTRALPRIDHIHVVTYLDSGNADSGLDYWNQLMRIQGGHSSYSSSSRCTDSRRFYYGGGASRWNALVKSW